MSKSIILQEYIAPSVAKMVTESKVVGGSGDMFMKGIMMMAECRNGNNRIYPRSEIERAVDRINSVIAENRFVLGELNHPDHLQIDLKNVSHAIVEAYMDGNNAIGKMKLLNTPSGNIAREILSAGIPLGVSSRGSGSVNEGMVSGFDFVTMDIVATPSAPDAYPVAIRESIEGAANGRKIMTLAEAVCEDSDAQKYLKKEIMTYLTDLLYGRK